MVIAKWKWDWEPIGTFYSIEDFSQWKENVNWCLKDMGHENLTIKDEEVEFEEIDVSCFPPKVFALDLTKNRYRDDCRKKEFH